MTFSYQDMSTTTFNGQRWYETPSGLFYPSITTVLGTTAPQEKIDSLNNWRNSLGAAKADAYTKSRADHGTMVHLLAERYLKNEEVEAPVDGKPIPPQDLNAFRALKVKLDKVDEVYGQEVALASNVLECAGRCDLIAVYKGRPVIVDFKTSGRIKNDKDIHDYKLQLCFYATAHNETFGTNIQEGVILMVAQSGFPLEFKVKLSDYYNELEERLSNFWKKALNAV